MRKVIAAINMTLDGFCDHTAMIADDELHQHYADLLKTADTILYGRITFQLMEYWRTVAKHPTGEPATDEFAVIMDHIPKIVFSRTVKQVNWEGAKLATRDIEAEVSALKPQAGKAILVGSPSLIVQMMNRHLIDEYQLCVHPVVAGSGLPLFKNIPEQTILSLVRTKTFASGAVTLYYEPTR